MSVLYFIFLVIVIVFAGCSLVAIIQFFIDLRKNSMMCKELKSALKRAKKCIGELEDVPEEVENNG